MAGFGLDDDFLAMDDETASPPLKQTRSLGRKQCAAHWLPELVDEQGVLAAGSWDDAENVVALWSVRLAQEANEGGEDEAMLDASADEPLCTVPHEGCVLDLATGCAPGLPPLLFTGSGAGGVACYAVRDGRSLTPHWREGAAAHRHTAVHAVGYDAETRMVAAACEDGTLALLDAAREGERTAELVTREAALLALCWHAPRTVVAAGSCLQSWDLRSGAPGVRFEAGVGVAVHCAPQLHCVAAHPQRSHLLAAGASDGSIYLWDARRAGGGPANHLALAHAQFKRAPGARRVGADVLGLQFGQTAYGELTSCGSDGSVQAWTGIESEAAAPRVLVQLHMPVNDIDLSEQGTLAAASDAEQLTFIDLRR